MPTTSVVAVIAVRSAVWTLNVPPADPTVIDLAPLGISDTVPEALTVPEKATSFAVMVMVLLDDVRAVETALVTLPVPSVVMVTPDVPEALLLSVTAPLEPDDVCNTNVLPDRALDAVMLPLAVNVRLPLVDVIAAEVPMLAEAPVVVTEKLPPTVEAASVTAPALVIVAVPGLPVFAVSPVAAV